MGETTALSSALVVVDYQNDFCHPDGAFGCAGHNLSAVQAVAEPIRHLRQQAHRSGVPVILVRVEHSAWTDDQAWIRRFEGLPAEVRPKGAVAAKGSWGADFYELDADDRDLVLVKHRYSAFSYTPLELVLRARHVTHVVICGVQTDVCVQGTARDALQAGFQPIVVSDAVATGDQGAHLAALDGIRLRVGPLAAAHEVIEAWSDG